MPFFDICLQMTLQTAVDDIAAFRIFGSYNNLPTHFLNVSIYLSATNAWQTGALCASGLSFPTGDTRQPFYANCRQSTTGASFISFVRWVPAGAVAPATRLTIAEVQTLRQGGWCQRPLLTTPLRHL